jgi:hypothetical protein
MVIFQIRIGVQCYIPSEIACSWFMNNLRKKSNKWFIAIYQARGTEQLQ